MITLLLGTDSLAKKQHIAQAAKSRGAEVEIYAEGSALPSLNQLFEQQLFGAPKLVVFDHVWKKLDSEDLLEQLGANKDANLFIVEESLDKRTKLNQEFLKDKRVTVVQLDAPIGSGLASEWIKNYCKEHNIKIDAQASLALARALLIDEDSVLDVARAQNELQKLKQYSEEGPITQEAISLLVESSVGVDIFELLNAIATKNKQQAMKMLNEYFETETADEKANAIKVAALLSDQFRSLLIALDSTQRRMPDEAVLEMTGWKSGRLFIMKKLSRNFTAPQVKQALAKLQNLDRELKTGSMPPHVVLDLIIADM
jgi:DNA polymerase III subunit delta